MSCHFEFDLVEAQALCDNGLILRDEDSSHLCTRNTFLNQQWKSCVLAVNWQSITFKQKVIKKFSSNVKTSNFYPSNDEK